MNLLGKKIDTEDLKGIFEPEEGSINFYYGRIGSGKTYSATADIHELLERGQVVYTNWHIDWRGFDERSSLWITIIKTVFFQSKFYYFPSTNLHYFDTVNTGDRKEPCPSCGVIHDPTIEFFSRLTDCHIFIDEGQWIFDSRSRLDKDWRKLILHTRHLNRSLNIISQRTQAVEVSARGQVNRFFKCEKMFTWPWLILRRTEYQDMKNDDVDDGETAEPASTKTYFARRKIMMSYNSQYLRAGMETSQKVYFEAYKLNVFQRLLLIVFNIFGIKIKDKVEVKKSEPQNDKKVKTKTVDNLWITKLKNKKNKVS